MNGSLTVHHTPEPNPDTSMPDPHRDHYSRTLFGFWLYLMTDCVLFASLFITFAVLRGNTFGGPSGKELFSLPLVFAETIILLLSSVTCGFAMIGAVKGQLGKIKGWLIATLILGVSFLAIELGEFIHFVEEGHSWKESAFLSSFFALVGTHGLHIAAGLLWLLVMLGQLACQGLTPDTFRRLAVFSLFWHFLDLIWVFIFTIVYLMGVL